LYISIAKGLFNIFHSSNDFSAGKARGLPDFSENFYLFDQWLPVNLAFMLRRPLSKVLNKFYLIDTNKNCKNQGLLHACLILTKNVKIGTKKTIAQKKRFSWSKQANREEDTQAQVILTRRVFFCYVNLW
jgi:hypothetical protein